MTYGLVCRKKIYFVHNAYLKYSTWSFTNAVRNSVEPTIVQYYGEQGVHACMEIILVCNYGVQIPCGSFY